MSNIVHNIASKLSGSHSGSESKKDTNQPAPVSDPSTNPPQDGPKEPSKGKDQEPTFSILPHPAKSNDPADLQPGGGLRSGAGVGADIFNTPGPFVPTDDMKNSLPAPLSREELQARQAALRSEVPGHGTQQGNLL